MSQRNHIKFGQIFKGYITQKTSIKMILRKCYKCMLGNSPLLIKCNVYILNYILLINIDFNVYSVMLINVPYLDKFCDKNIIYFLGFTGICVCWYCWLLISSFYLWPFLSLTTICQRGGLHSTACRTQFFSSILSSILEQVYCLLQDRSNILISVLNE